PIWDASNHEHSERRWHSEFFLFLLPIVHPLTLWPRLALRHDDESATTFSSELTLLCSDRRLADTPTLPESSARTPFRTEKTRPAQPEYLHKGTAQSYILTSQDPPVDLRLSPPHPV